MTLPQGLSRAAPPVEGNIRVMIVDDSAFMRFSLQKHLGEMQGIEVAGAARDGQEALEMIPLLNPDVITMDVEMPRLDGLSTLRQVMSKFPRPVIMLSSLTVEGARETIQALAWGAVDFVPKPAAKANVTAIIEELTAKIRSAAKVRVRNLTPIGPMVSETRPSPAAMPRPSSNGQAKTTRKLGVQDKVLVIGSSTGGPRALNMVVPALPADLPAAVLIVQHMPVGFTRSLAERLDSASKLNVKEAEAGDQLAVGQVLLAPGGYHMTIEDGDVIALNQNPTVHGVRPAVDVTLSSAARRYGRSVVTAILTGMGRDGTNGALLVQTGGGCVIAEDESSCVVYGMPRSVIEAGAARVVEPLPNIAAAIERAVRNLDH